MDKPSSIPATGLDYFRRVVALLYREIGVLTPRNHAGVAAKAKLRDGFFADRKAQAKQCCRSLKTDQESAVLLAEN